MPKQKKDSESSSDNIPIDINIKVIEQSKIDDSYNNFLVINIKGSDINHVVINTLRRVIMELIPIYAFDKSNIEITKNTSIYNNDYMRLRLSNFPIINIENLVETIDRSANLEYESNITSFDKKIEDINIIAERDQAIKLEKAQNFIIYINVKNTSAHNQSITTAHPDIKYYYQTKNIESPYTKPLLIIKLKPGEEFVASLTSTLNIGLVSANYIPTSVCSYSEETPNSYNLNIESLKQISEQNIIIRGCEIIILKLKHFLQIFTKKISEYTSTITTDDYNIDVDNSSDTKESDESTESENLSESSASAEKITKTKNKSIKSSKNTESAIKNLSENVLEPHHIKGIINIENESHTFGNLISRLLQDHESILFAGYKIDNLLIKQLTIGYNTNNVDIIDILEEVITKGIKIYENIKKNTEKLKL